MSKVSTKNINRQKLDWLFEQPLNVQLEVVSQHMEIVRIVINSILEGEVVKLAGEKYSRTKPNGGRYDRWGANPGSVKVGGQKIKIAVPRIYDKAADCNRSLETYESLQSLPEQDLNLVKQVLHGISTRDYQGVIDRLSDSFGDSASSVSRQFQERTKAALAEFESRKFNNHHFVALFIDGKHLAGDQMVIVLGVTAQGYKIPLGVVQTNTENATSIGNLLKELVERGLKFEEGILCIIDGAKGLKKAVEEVFGKAAIIQRCQWHKRENVISYLSEENKEKYRRKLQRAYNEDTYKEAKEQLKEIHGELQVLNRGAAKSLQEGLEETLTLHRLRVYPIMGRSFKTTNCIESVNSCLAKYIGRVKNWSSSEMRFRWVCSGLMEIEKKMQRVFNYKKIPKLKAALKREVDSRNKLEPLLISTKN
ncbi:MAG: IS256 family transposase [Saprospiraceae bacterium]